MEADNSSCPSPTSKENVIASIESARAELEHALTELHQLPTLDPNTIRYTAHAMKNYLTVTTGCVDLLMQALADYPDRQISIWLEGLRHVTRLMTQTVRRLSNAAVAVNLDVKWEKVDLPTLVRRGCDYYMAQAREKRIQIVFESSVESPYVWTDRVMAAAVLDNLLSNAVKFSGSGSIIRVSIAVEPSHLVCSVQDEGPGLSTEEQTKLFQRGVRLSPAPTGGESSTGYGLAVSMDLVNALGGSIWCESQPGRGSRFSFRLPVYVEGQS